MLLLNTNLSGKIPFSFLFFPPESTPLSTFYLNISKLCLPDRASVFLPQGILYFQAKVRFFFYSGVLNRALIPPQVFLRKKPPDNKICARIS